MEGNDTNEQGCKCADICARYIMKRQPLCFSRNGPRICEFVVHLFRWNNLLFKASSSIVELQLTLQCTCYSISTYRVMPPHRSPKQWPMWAPCLRTKLQDESPRRSTPGLQTIQVRNCTLLSYKRGHCFLSQRPFPFYS